MAHEEEMENREKDEGRNRGEGSKAMWTCLVAALSVFNAGITRTIVALNLLACRNIICTRVGNAIVLLRLKKLIPNV